MRSRSSSCSGSKPSSFTAKAFTRAVCWLSNQAESRSRKSKIVVHGSFPQPDALRRGCCASSADCLFSAWGEASALILILDILLLDCDGQAGRLLCLQSVAKSSQRLYKVSQSCYARLRGHRLSVVLAQVQHSKVNQANSDPQLTSCLTPW